MCRAENIRALAPDKNWNFDFLARICHVGDDQRSVRLNKKKKSTNTSPYPDEVIDRLARAFYPAILACWNSEEGQREFAAWQAEQAHISGKEKQEVPACWVFVKQFSRNDTATACQDWLRVPG